MTDEIHDAAPSTTTPHPSLRTLDVLVGTWQVSGPGHHGTVTYEWMPGGHFLIQHEPGSPARYHGTFDAGANSATGAWSWPGGGYDSTMTRVRP